MILGITLEFNYSEFDNDIFDSDGTSFSAGSFVRHYFLKGKIKPYIQGSIGFGRADGDTMLIIQADGDISVLSTETQSDRFMYGFSGGVAFFISHNFSLDLGVAYERLRTTNNDNSTRSILRNTGFIAGFKFFL